MVLKISDEYALRGGHPKPHFGTSLAVAGPAWPGSALLSGLGCGTGGAELSVAVIF